ncbi:DUF1800 domain-containing protein [Massilia sp. IC2-477]|uniref:DUF1800 family protein n=1 Tax=Massilia sp. IC2-477 TaxID=2887198 RepID=UPI001D11459B|nr:DUF1800 family protein [Massilia sp. IC2-477]MCC2957265.1 DUF1800 domain-containing protein [Massilia sp. IC2-477]
MQMMFLLLRWAALTLALGLAPAHAAAPMDKGQTLHLLDRLGYGPRPGDVARVRDMGAAAYVESQLAPPPLPRWLAMRVEALSDPGVPGGEEALLRAIASPRQLEEVLTEFWLGYFGNRGAAGLDSALRPHVFSRYADLVEAARGPADEGAAQRALARHFVEAPSSALLRSLASVWKTSSGDQRAVLRVLLTNPEFLAPAQWNTRPKDDFRFVASAVRASGVWVENVAPLAAFLRRPMTAAQRADFAERLSGGQFALAMAPPQPQRYASSAPPLRASSRDDPAQGMVSQPGPVLMEAPTPSAIAAAAAVRSLPAEPERLRQLLGSPAFQRY